MWGFFMPEGLESRFRAKIVWQKYSKINLYYIDINIIFVSNKN